MKGQHSLSDIEYANRKRRTKRDEFLQAMDDIIAWEEWCALVEPYYPDGKRGRPPRGVETMLRMYLLSNWFNLSDEGLEDAIYDSYAFRKFMGVDFLDKEQVPDSTTLCKFRALLDKHGVTKLIFGALTDFLDKHGKLMHGGSIVDATIVNAPTSTKNSAGKRDPEMHSTQKGNQWYFGERLHIAADAGSGYIHGLEVTAANVDERSVVPSLLREDDEVVYGDAGYCGIEKREEIRNDPKLSQIDWRINAKKPWRKNKWAPGPGVFWYSEQERQKSSVRAKVEYPFLIVKRLFGYCKVRYRGLRKNLTQAYILCALANLFMLRQSGYAEVN
jgi:IS5 family transposase